MQSPVRREVGYINNRCQDLGIQEAAVCFACKQNLGLEGVCVSAKSAHV